MTKSWNHVSSVNIIPTLVIDTSREKSSRVLHHGSRKIRIFSKKFEIYKIDFYPYPECPYPQKRNRPGFVDISPTLVIVTSMERSLRELQYGNPIFFFKKVWNWILSCADMYLYDDIGEASSSLRGLTSSLRLYFSFCEWNDLVYKITIPYYSKQLSLRVI